MRIYNLKSYVIVAASILGTLNANADFTIDGTIYKTDTISQRQIGPGIIHTRMRIPDFPLNVNMIQMDMSNANNRIELQQANDRLGSTEKFADAYIRHKAEGKNPIAGANASFWCVPAEKPASEYVLGHPYGGCVYNGKIVEETNMYRDRWEGGPQASGMVGIDLDKNLWIEQLSWKGYAKCAKWEQTPEIFQVNRRCYENELVMYNSFYGTNRAFNTTDANSNVYLRLKDGEKWAVNKEFVAVVQEIITDKGALMLGEYDLCLSGTGDYKAMLEQLAIGDEITLSYAWTVLDTEITPNIDNIVEGQSLVMRNGEMTWLNDKGYCSMTYSRTGYGSSADQKTLYIIVIDMSTSDYGYSAGCNTKVMCQIMQQSGCANLCSMDAGGSAQMMIAGTVVNKTTEGTPRATANGMMLYSTAPRSNEVTTIRFDRYKVTMPINGSYTPKMLGYNEYGDLIDENFKGFTLECDPSIGSATGDTFTASSTPAYGAIRAKYNGCIVSKEVTTVPAEMAICIKPNIIIDGTISYPVEVASVVDRDTYFYDPAKLDWKVEDPTIATIENGVLKGLKEGTTKISCSLGDFTDETQVTVQIAEQKFMPVAWDGWTLKAVGAKELALNAEGVLSMNYTSGRGPYIKMTKDITLYSLPRNITLEFTPSIPIDYIQVDLRSASMTNNNYIAFGKDNGGFAAGTKYTIDFNLSNIFDLDDMQTYPISLKEITFYPPATGVVKGAQNITIHAMNVEYANPSGVDKVIENTESSIKIYPNPVIDGSMTVCSSDDEAMVEIYNTSGSLVKKTIAPTNGGSATIEVSDLAPGIYFVKIDTTSESKTQKIIIR